MIDEIVKKYPNDVKVVFKNFPLGNHKQARKAAIYCMAAGRQGKFKEMYYKIFENDNWRGLRNNEDLPKEYAEEMGLDMIQFMNDVNDPSLVARIDLEYNQLRSLANSYETDQYKGVRQAVPKFFVNGKEPNLGRRTVEDWSKVIDAELAKINSK